MRTQTLSLRLSSSAGSLASLGLLLGALLGGCDGTADVTLRDGDAAPEAPRLRDRIEEDLSRDYVVTSKVRLYIEPRGGVDVSHWLVRSDAPAVFRVDSVHDASDDKSGRRARVAECTALSVGQAVLRLIDERGVDRAVTTVTVQAPDRAQLSSQAQLRLSGLGPAAEAKDARILVGGKGVFGVTYYRGERRLFGAGVLTKEAGAELTVENPASEFRDVNDWLFVTPAAAGSFPLRLTLQGAELSRLMVTGVPEAEVGGLALVHQAAAPEKDGEIAYVLARVTDKAGREVLGAYSDWTLGGVPQGGPDGMPKTRAGDLYRYEYGPSAAERPLAAQRGALSSAVSVPIKAKSGQVTDTTYLGCSAAPSGAPGAGAAAPLLGGALLPLLLLRRRRAAHRRRG